MTEEGGVYSVRVQSASDPTSAHTVMVKMTCDCHAFRFGKACRHIDEAFDLIREFRRKKT